MNKSINPSFIVLALLMLPGCQEAELSENYIEGFIQSNDEIELYYRVIGAGSDTLLVVHGGPGLHMNYLKPDLEPLTETNTVIYFDQRSAGRSTVVVDSVSLHIDKYIADLEEVRRYFGIDSLTLFGHSWGAVLGARYVRAYPDNVSRLVMVSPGSVRYDPYEELFLEAATAWMDSSILVKFWELQKAFENANENVREACREFFDLFNRGGFYDPFDQDAFRRMRGDFCNAPEETLLNYWKINDLTLHSLGKFDWRDDFSNLNIPVLVITGTRDVFPVKNYQEWEAAFPDGRLILINGAGHYPHVEQPDPFFNAIQTFLEE